jgi:hypothetical protein
MALPRVQFTVRWIMLTSAVVAILLFAATMRARSRNFDRLATFHADQEDQCRFVLGVRANDVEDALKEEKKCLAHAEQLTTDGADTFWKDAAHAHELAEQHRQQLDALAELRDYHHELKEKYNWAAANPWKQLYPDGPEPVYPQFGGPVPRSFSCRL